MFSVIKFSKLVLLVIFSILVTFSIIVTFSDAKLRKYIVIANFRAKKKIQFNTNYVQERTNVHISKLFM